jgi:hypothetical protein
MKPKRPVSWGCKFIYIQNLLIAILGYKNVSPLQAWTGPEGSRRFRLPDFKTIDT